MCTPSRERRSITSPPSFVDIPRESWPPQRIDNSSPASRANPTAVATSAALSGRTTASGEPGPLPTRAPSR